MVRLRTDDRAERLLDPVRARLDAALALLPDAPDLAVTVGDVPAWFALAGDAVVLSAGLEGPGVHHPLEPAGPLPPLDRWRRAAGSVLEAAALRELSRRAHLAPGDDWRWVGAAIHAADATAPELGLALPDVALAVTTGSPGSNPRAGAAVMRAWAAQGIDPMHQARYLVDGGVVSAVEWAKLGRWVLSPEGGLGLLPVRVDRVPESDVPCELAAWSWRPLAVPAHPRGGVVRVEGDGLVEDPWGEAGVPLRTLAAAASTSCRFVPDAGGPVGAWEVASAEGFGQVLGARGIRFEFHADGRLGLVLADAFVGPLAAVAMAEEIGTSGSVSGRWKVAGRQLLRFEGIETQALTLHGRRDRFLMPAKGFGLGEWLKALDEDAWAWQVVQADRMVMRGRMLGGEVEVRLRRA